MSATAHDLQIVRVPTDELHPDPANPRRIGAAELETLTRSLQQFGFVDPIIARHDDHVVIGGHQRLVAARRLGWTEVPVIFVDLDPHQAHLLNLALNKISGEWDEALLARLLADLQVVPDLDIHLSGFGDDEIQRLLKQLDAEAKRHRPETFDPDAAVDEAEANPATQPGDLWLLGDHRLLCGDSTKPDDVARLMDGKRAVLMATDPPYLVDYTGGEHPTSKANKGRATKDKHWDEYHDPQSSVDFFVAFLRVGLDVLQPKSAIYQWHATRRQKLVEEAWSQCGLLVHQTIIWAKARGVLTHSHYLWSHEPCFYGWVEGKPPERKPPANERTVWGIDQAGEDKVEHPTQKPVELFLRPIVFHTQAGDIVYEPFSGSGTQLIAAERLGRCCYAMEQEPVYVDVAVRRWEAFTGETAVRA
jgi:DNA modification methylase